MFELGSLPKRSITLQEQAAVMTHGYICKIIMCKCKVGERQWLLWAVDKVKDVAIDLRFPLITESHHSKHVVHLNMWEALNWRRTDSLFFLLAVSELSGGCHRPLESAVGSPSRLFCLSVQLSVSCIKLTDWLIDCRTCQWQWQSCQSMSKYVNDMPMISKFLLQGTPPRCFWSFSPPMLSDHRYLANQPAAC